MAVKAKTCDTAMLIGYSNRDNTGMRKQTTEIRLHAASCLLIVLLATLGGCIQPPARIAAQPPPYHFQPATLRAIDERIFNTSVLARHEAETYALVVMKEWLLRVRQRIEDDFIPWYSSYGIQQWIATKVVAFELLYTEGEATPEERLVSYLQEQFYEQVLEPVSRYVDPQTVMQDTAVNYLRELRTRLDQLSSAYDVPAFAVRQHLETIPAILVQEVPPRRASLYEVMHTDDLQDLPAYQALLKKIDAVSDADNPRPSADRLRIVANQVVARLFDSLPLRGGMATASTLVGGYWGVAITAGSAAYASISHAHEKPAMEAQLREKLDEAMDLMWKELVEDPQGGITAPVQHMSTQIEDGVMRSIGSPLSVFGDPIAPIALSPAATWGVFTTAREAASRWLALSHSCWITASIAATGAGRLPDGGNTTPVRPGTRPSTTVDWWGRDRSACRRKHPGAG